MPLTPVKYTITSGDPLKIEITRADGTAWILTAVISVFDILDKNEPIPGSIGLLGAPAGGIPAFEIRANIAMDTKPKDAP